MIRLSSPPRFRLRPASTFVLGFFPRGRSLFGFATCILCLLSINVTLRADEFTQNSQYKTRLFSGGTLTIASRVGDIHVSGWDDPYVQVDAEKLVRAGSQASAAPLFEKIRVVLEGKDKQVHLSTVYPPRRLWRPFRGESKLTVNFDIKMPYDADLVLQCVDGDVRVSGVAGSEKLRVNYGDVEIDVPDVWKLRSFYAHTLLGYIQSDLHGTQQDSAGLRQKLFFWNHDGRQAIAVNVRMGGVFIYSDPQ